MKQVLRSEQRGHANHGWLDSYHTFSFADYYNPAMMGFGPLRVINQDRVAGGDGFGMHPHRDMEIITYMVDGAIEHQDSMGSRETVRPGEVQRMSAGTGVRHSEYNPDPKKEAHLLQIWIEPDVRGIEPEYEQKSFVEALEKKSLVLAVSKDGRDGSMKIHRDADLWIGKTSAGETVDLGLAKGRALWLQLVRGEVSVEGETLKPGDAIAINDQDRVSILSREKSEFLVFDLA